MALGFKLVVIKFLATSAQLDRDFASTAVGDANLEAETFEVPFYDYYSGELEHSGDKELAIGRSVSMDGLARRRRKKKKNKRRKKKKRPAKKPPVKSTPPTSLFKGIDELIGN